jgi:predicted transcriptional regulator
MKSAILSNIGTADRPLRGHRAAKKGRRVAWYANPNTRRVLALVMGRPGVSVRELGAAAGLSFQGALYHLKRLRAAGLVTWEPNLSRTLRASCRFIPLEELKSQATRTA